MFGLTILRILILCEPLLCLARPQYFCCLPCPLTNDCENPYYQEPPMPSREEPPCFRSMNGNIGGRGNCDSGFMPQMPFPPMPGPPRPRDARTQCKYHGQGQGQGHGPDQNCINLTIKCNGEREVYEDPYNKGADWFRGDLPDGKLCWVLQCNEPSLRSGSDPPPSQQTPPPSAPPPQTPAPPPQTPPPETPSTPPPSQDSPPPEDSDDEPSNNRRSGYSSYPEPRRRSNFFTNLFSLPGQLADSVLSGSIQLN